MTEESHETRKNVPSNWDRRCWFHAIVNSLVATGIVILGYQLNNDYGWGLFIAVPVLTGFVVAFTSRGIGVIPILFSTCLLSMIIFLVTAWEGILCVVLAFPIVMISMGLGAIIGYFVARKVVHRYGNPLIVLFSITLLMLVGWNDRKEREPQDLEVITSMNFYAPMKEVWNVVKESGKIDGSTGLLKFIGLPVPRNCELLPNNQRVCHFDEGEILQTITGENYGKNIDFKIVDSFEVRHWLHLDEAGYRFVQRSDHVEVIRTDRIRSELQPRWYWHWFEEQCVRLQHRYVMSSMRRKVEIE